MNYLWDLDGTLLDSYPVILKSLKTVLKAQNMPISETLGEEILRSSVRAYLGTDELFSLYYADIYDIAFFPLAIYSGKHFVMIGAFFIKRNIIIVLTLIEIL